MLSESEKRAALLAVSRYGADTNRVYTVVRAVLERRSHGASADLLECFEREQLLTGSQAHELRHGLDKTIAEPESKNGSGSRDAMAPAHTPQIRLHSDETETGPVSDPLANLTMLGEYCILRRLGEGGTGTVFLAYQEAEKRQVAIKVLATDLAEKQNSLDRFYREAKSGALLSHPNIVRNFAAGHDTRTGAHYLVLEYVDGPSVYDLLDKFHHLPVGDAVHIILDVARALEHAHSRNVVHRDIKPGNILITLSGLAKLADMGLAKRVDDPGHLTQARQGFGTPYYMPYEQAMNAKYADARSDIYALGATFYHLLTGEVPFPGETSLEIIDKKAIGAYVPASMLNPDVPRVLDGILAKMLAKEPRERYQTASELIVDLERSNLAAAVLSFIDPDRALEDPVVRQRLAGPAATQPDLRNGAERPAEQRQIWYLRVRDDKGGLRVTKLTLTQVMKRLREGKLAATTEAARFARGHFKPLKTYVEFQEALTPPRAETEPSTTNSSWLSPKKWFRW